MFRSVILPAHALAGAAGFLGALVYLFQQIRFWVWFPSHDEPAYLGLHAVAVGCCLALAWIGLSALWEALGSHDSAVFKAHVSERLKRQFRIEAERKWTFGQLLLVSGCLILALLLTTLLLFLVMDPSGNLPKGFARFALLGATMTFAEHLIRRRLPGELSARRGFWFTTTALFFFTTILAVIRMSPLTPLAIGWAIGLTFSTAHFIFVRVTRGAPHTTTDNGTKILAPPRPAFRLRLSLESFALLAALFALVHLVENQRGERAWNATEHAIAGAGITPDRKISPPPTIPDEENFFTALDEAAFLRPGGPDFDAAKWKADHEEASRRIPDAYDPLHPRLFKDPFEAGPFIDLSQAGPYDITTGRIDPSGEAVVKNWLDQHEEFFGPIVQAAKRPDAWFPHEPDKALRFQPLPNFVTLRNMTRAFAVRVQFAIDHDDDATALEGIRVVSQCHHMLRTSPSLVSTMIAVWMMELEASLIREGIRQNVWSSGELQRLQAQLDRAAPLRSLDLGLQAEMIWLTQVPNESVIAESFLPCRWRRERAWLVKSIEALLPNGWPKQMKSRAARIYLDRVLPGIDADAHRVHFERHPEDEKVILRLEQRKSLFDMLALIGIPNFQRAMQTAGRAQALVDMTRIACALERFKLARGAYPATLAELAPEWIEAIPHDVTNGEPLLYRANSEGGYTLYSRGINQKDDGGHAEEKDVNPLDWVWAR